jgi:hypothetical protein
MKGKRFVIWKYVKKNGKQTKVPIHPIRGCGADCSTFNDCTSYSEALRAVEEKTAAGVGVVLGNGLAGVDLDDCVKDGNLINNQAIEIIKQLNSYSEISPSGTGVKIFLKGKKPGPKCRKGNIEIYDANRFFTITGNHLGGTPFEVHNRTKELETLYHQLWPKKAPDDSNPQKDPPANHSISDSKIIEKAMAAKNGGKFSTLWRGDHSEYPSQSEADLALCQALAFWVGADSTHIDALFRQSGLYRDKWDREDYRDRTINEAISRTSEVYTPPKIAKKRMVLKLRNNEPDPEPKNLEFPAWVMSGVAGDFATLYSSYLEVPVHFLYITFITCLGSVIADSLTLASEIAPQPRLFVLLLGESADDRKSTALNKVVEFFKSSVDGFSVCLGVGSAEGLQERLKDNNRLLLCLDEFKQFVSKCKIEASVLLPCINTLFESNHYESRTKKTKIDLNNVYLSMMAASTLDTYENTWSKQFTDIGFNNRLFLVPGSGKRKHSLPAKITRSQGSLSPVVYESAEVYFYQKTRCVCPAIYEPTGSK